MQWNLGLDYSVADFQKIVEYLYRVDLISESEVAIDRVWSHLA